MELANRMAASEELEIKAFANIAFTTFVLHLTTLFDLVHSLTKTLSSTLDRNLVVKSSNHFRNK